MNTINKVIICFIIFIIGMIFSPSATNIYEIIGFILSLSSSYLIGIYAAEK